MSEPTPEPYLPPYVYKILDAAPPTPLPDVLPLSALDAADGFIHLSNAARVPGTAGLYFAAHTSLHLLKVDTQKTIAAGGVYRWVDPECPHLYAREEGEWAHLGAGNVEEAREVLRKEGETWEEALRELAVTGWLVDAS